MVHHNYIMQKYAYCFSFIGVYLSLNNTIIPNHGYVMISDIGSTNNDSLLCHTNKAAPSDGNSGGNWFAPDGVAVDKFQSRIWEK